MTQTIQMANRAPGANGSPRVAPFERPRPRYVPGRRHVLDMDDFSRQEIEDTFQNADAMREVMNREIKKVPTLRGKTIITLFTEASTRTRVSFEQAGKILSADVINVSGSGSSVEKGESLYNTALTLQAMNADIIVIRHGHSGRSALPGAAPRRVRHQRRRRGARASDPGVAGHVHHAQLLRSRRGTQGDVIIGDILYSRVARSNLWGLTAMGADVTLCAPPTLLPQDLLDRRADVDGHPFADVRIVTDIESALKGADVVYALRLQLERQQAGHLPSLREYSRSFGINEERLKLASPDALVMHPGPMNEGVEIDPAVAHGSRSMIEEQVTNGVAVRMALLYSVATPIREGYPKRP